MKFNSWAVKWLFGLVFSLLLLTSTNLKSAESNDDWPLWHFFQDQFITESGRVVDPYDGNDITTSEGQSYAMFFALVNNQPELFDKLLVWTEQNLAQGDLANNLPAWKWGENTLGLGKILDKNSASDSDLWILYTLLEASRLWNKPEYGRLAEQLANTILQNEVVLIPELGYFLLPAVSGFSDRNNSITLNPSYVPMQLMDYFYTHLPNDKWQSLRQTSLLLTMESSKRGFAPDWIDFNTKDKVFDNPTEGSYNAIRVYLWAGMLSADSEHWPILKLHFAKSVQFVNKLQGVPESINTELLAFNNYGNIGFDISFLPLITRFKYAELENVIMTKIIASDLMTSDSYYQTVLSLYGLGWTEKRFKFSANGRLIVSWKDEK